MSNRRPIDQPIPLRPDPRALHERNVWAVARAGLALARARGTRSRPIDLVEKTWPNDETAKLILRAPTTPTTIGSALGNTIVADVITATAPASAAATLLDAGLQFQFDRAAGISVPGFQATANTVIFVGEGAPIPVKQLILSAAQLTPHKLASISTLTEEMIAESNGNAELAVRDALTRSVGLALDSVLFDETAGDAIRPPGLRYGIAGGTPSNDLDAFTAMLADLKTLTAAVAPIGGPIYYVVSADRVVAMNLLSRGNSDVLNLLPSAAIAPDEIIAVAVNGLASAADAVPQLSTAHESLLHMEDATPLPIVGSTLANPVTSLWQTGAVGLRLLFEIDWAVRDPRAIAWMTGVKW
jgi:hypothetical protein